MSDMCFDDFDYDRHSDMCDCEECTSDIEESNSHKQQNSVTNEELDSSHNIENTKCIHCGGDPIQIINGNKYCEYCEMWW